MGEYKRRKTYGVETGDNSGRGADDRRPSNFEQFLEGGKATRFRPKHPELCSGDRRGRLVILRELPKRNQQRQLLVQCDCGAMPGRVFYCNVQSGKTVQCNTCALEATKKYRKQYFCYEDAMSDDEHRRRLLNRLSAAIGRCHRPKTKRFENYGGRGISVYKPWHSDKRAFLTYIQTVPGWDNPELEMDREDNNGNYEPGNIRFISRKENVNNRRSVVELQRRYDAAVARIAELEREIAALRAGLRPD